MQELKAADKDFLRGGGSFILSVFLHIVVFLLSAFLLSLLDNRQTLSSGYVEVTTVRGISLPEKTEEKSEEGIKDENIPAETIEEKVKSEDNSVSAGYLDMRTSGFDSTSLNQVYRESTLNLNIKYPVGWVFLDQQVKKKIDGITFWAAQGNYDPPPYIHVEVLEKYLFNENRYKYHYDFRDFTGYYNDPVEMDNQVTQVVYIRTDDDEDFSIKLIMKGKDQFKSFQPVFFAMIKSFRFGNSLF